MIKDAIEYNNVKENISIIKFYLLLKMRKKSSRANIFDKKDKEKQKSKEDLYAWPK